MCIGLLVDVSTCIFLLLTDVAVVVIVAVVVVVFTAVCVCVRACVRACVRVCVCLSVSVFRFRQNPTREPVTNSYNQSAIYPINRPTNQPMQSTGHDSYSVPLPNMPVALCCVHSLCLFSGSLGFFSKLWLPALW